MPIANSLFYMSIIRIHAMPTQMLDIPGEAINYCYSNIPKKHQRIIGIALDYCSQINLNK